MDFDFCTGTIYLANGDKYSGDWKDARRHGVGVYVYWYENSIHLSIKVKFFRTYFCFSDGDRYEGEWRNDERVSSSRIFVLLSFDCLLICVISLSMVAV